jgi:hypothetical protein
MATKNSADSPTVKKIDASDDALVILLTRLKTSVDPNEIRELSRQIEQVIFHKQFENA